MRVEKKNAEKLPSEGKQDKKKEKETGQEVNM